MPQNLNPWDGMERPHPPAFSTKTVDSMSPYNFMWVKDSSGNPGLAISCDEKIEGRLSSPHLENIEISLQPDKKTLAFLLKDKSLRRQFRIFCEDCIANVHQLKVGRTAELLFSLNKTLENWTGLFEEQKTKKFSKTLEHGLLGELLVMKNIMMNVTSPSNSVLAWNGPKGHEQDFAYNSCLIEVKCQLASKDRAFMISSLEQLDDVSGPIYISHVGISPAAVNTCDCFSLPSLVDEIVVSLSNDNYAIDTLLGCLEIAGYQHDGSDNFDYYVIGFFNNFKINSDFPRIIRSDLAPAIEKCSYRLNASMLNHWQISKSQVIKEISE